MSTAIASFVPRCTIALITALTSCQHNFHVYQTVKGNKGNKTQGVTWYKKNKTQATTLDAKEHSGKVEPKPSGLVLFFQMPRGLTPQSCPKDGSWLHMKLTRDLVWSKKTKRDKLANPAYHCCSIHSSEVDANRRFRISYKSKKLWSKF